MDAGLGGFEGAKLDDFALAGAAAEHQRTALPLRMPKDLDPDREPWEPDAGDPPLWPGAGLSDAKRTVEHMTLERLLPFHYRTYVLHVKRSGWVLTSANSPRIP
jgi:hypothetical protein